MATYPTLPNNRIVVNGTDLSEKFGLVMIDGYELGMPEPNTYTVDIPGRDGAIDLTEALTGDVTYQNREQTFNLYKFGLANATEVQALKNEVINFLHGKAFDYTLSFDPGYTYHGRFSVSEATHEGTKGKLIAEFTIDIDANPYKVKGTHTQIVDAIGGTWVVCESGRRPVHPYITCGAPVTVNWNGEEFTVPAGNTYRMNDVVFTEGTNRLWLNIYSWTHATWEEIADKTWADLGSTSWAHVVVSEGTDTSFTGDGTVILEWSEEYI